MLTTKQEAFCLAYIESGNATDAYGKAGYSSRMSSKSINEAVSRMLKKPKIVARIEGIRLEAAEAAKMTLAGHLDELKRLRDLAANEGRFSAAVTAEVSRGKASGFYTEKLEHTVAGPPDITLIINGTRTT